MQPALLSVIALLLSVDGFLPPDQKNSLVSLYDATGGPFWTNKWNISADPCDDPVWFGVVCDSPKVNVNRLTLNNNNLTGSLPDMHLPALIYMYIKEALATISCWVAHRYLAGPCRTTRSADLFQNGPI